MLGNTGRTERSAAQYLPYIGHIGPQTVLLEDGSLLAMAHVAGQPFELADHAMRNARLRLLNVLYRNIADDNLTLCTHLVRHRETRVRPPAVFRSTFGQSLDATYREKVLGQALYRNDYYITMIVSPRSLLGTGFAKTVKRLGKRFPEIADGLARELEDQWYVLANGLDGFGIRRLGLYEHDDVMFSEIAEALRLIITGAYLRVPVVSGHMGDSIYTDRAICGRRGIEIRGPSKSTFGTIFSFREYPAKTRPGMLNTLLSAPFPLVLSQSFAFVTRAQAQDSLSLKSAQMVGAADKATSQIVGLEEAADALSSNEFVMGSHHLSLAVYGDTLGEVEDRAGKARGRLADSGSVVVEERLGLEAAFWSQLPGNLWWRTLPVCRASTTFPLGKSEVIGGRPSHGSGPTAARLTITCRTSRTSP
jgi:type IV secretion system protein VirB4